MACSLDINEKVDAFIEILEKSEEPVKNVQALLTTFILKTFRTEELNPIKDEVIREFNLSKRSDQISDYRDLFGNDAVANAMDSVNEEMVNIIVGKYLNPEAYTLEDDIKSKTDELEHSSEKKAILKNSSTFIDDTYGGQSLAKMDMMQKFQSLIGNSTMFMKDSNGDVIEIATGKLLSLNLYRLQQELYSDIIRDLKELRKVDLPENVFDGFELVKAIMDQYYNWNPTIINNSRSRNTALFQKSYRTFNNYFILSHFDQLLQSQCPGLVDIDQRYFGLLRQIADGKYFAHNKNENLGTSWGDDTELSDGVGELNQSMKTFLGNLWLFSKDGTKTRLLKVQEIADAWCDLKNLVFHPELRLLDVNGKIVWGFANTTDGRKFIKEYLTDSAGNVLTVHDLVTDMVDDPTKLDMLLKLATSDVFAKRMQLPITKQLIYKSMYALMCDINLGAGIYPLKLDLDGNVYQAFHNSKGRNIITINDKTPGYYNHLRQFLDNIERMNMNQLRMKDTGEYENVRLSLGAKDANTLLYIGNIAATYSALLGSKHGLYSNAESDYSNEIKLGTITIDRSGLSLEKRSDKYITFTDGKVTFKVGSNLKVSIKLKNGNFTNFSDLSTLADAQWDVIKEILQIQDYPKEAFINQSASNLITAETLISLAGNVMYNYGVSSILQNRNDLDDFNIDEEVKGYFTTEGTYKLTKDKQELQPFNPKNNTKINNLMDTIDLLNGKIRDAVTKGADGKMINTITTSLLASKATQQWHRDAKQLGDDYACKDFSLHDIYKGFEIARDVKQNLDSKKVIEFSPAENFAFGFISDYATPMNDTDKTIRVLPLIISDKERILKIKLDLNKKVLFKNSKGLSVEEQLCNLTLEDLYDYIKLQLGGFYEHLYNQIKGRYDRLKNYVTNPDGTINLAQSQTFASQTENLDLREMLIMLDGNDTSGVNYNTLFTENGILNFKGINQLIDLFISDHSDEAQNFDIDEEAVKLARKYDLNYPTTLLLLKGVINEIKLEDDTTLERQKIIDKIIKSRNDDLLDRAIEAAKNLIKELQLRAQLKGDSIDIVENSFYNIDKGHFVPNYGLVDQLYRWGKIDLVAAESMLPTGLLATSHSYGAEAGKEHLKFFKAKSFQVVSDILQENGYINLFAPDGKRIPGALRKLGNKEIAGTLDAKNGLGKWSQGGKLALAAIRYRELYEGGIKEKAQQITDLNQLSDIGLVLQAFKFIKYLNSYKYGVVTGLTIDEAAKSISDNYSTMRECYSLDDYLRNPKFSLLTLENAINDYFKWLDIERGIANYNSDNGNVDMYAEVRKNVFENDKIEIEKQYNKRIEDSNTKYDSNIASIDEQMGLITSVEESERSDAEKERLVDLIAEKEQLKEAKAEAEKKLKESLKETITKVTDRYNKVLEQVPAYIKAVLANPNFAHTAEIVINPDLEKYNAFSFLYGQEYTIATVGTHLNHPGMKNKDDLKAFESLSWAQQVKRNVSLTAAKHLYSLNSLNGFGTYCKIAQIVSESDAVYNLTGALDEMLNDDGANYTNGVTHRLENYSLGSDAVGVDKKNFFHMEDGASGTGFIGKNATFVGTNLRIRNSKAYRLLNFQMLRGAVGYLNPYLTNGGLNITESFETYYDSNTRKWEFSKMNYEDFDYKIPTSYKPHILYEVLLEDGSWTAANGLLQGYNVRVIGDSIKFKDGYTTFKFSNVSLIDSTGEVKSLPNAASFNFRVKLDNVHDIWEFFGGAYSGKAKEQVINGDLILTMDENSYDESSFDLTTWVVNNVGKRREGVGMDVKVESQTQVDQYLKDSMIHYLSSIETIKLGLNKINKRSDIRNENYIPLFMEMDMHDAGVQLNAEHHSDDSVLSMMTLVLNALGARGYTSLEADKTYQALQGLTNAALLEYIDYSRAGDSPQKRQHLENFIAHIIGDTIQANSTLDEGTLAGALMHQALKLLSRNKNFKFEEVRLYLPIDDPALLRNMISKLASGLTKRCIRVKFPGSMDVMSPSNSIYRLYDGKMLSEYNGDLTALTEADKKAPILKPHEIKIDRVYHIEGCPGADSRGYIKINYPTDYWQVRRFLATAEGQKVEVREVLSEGRELASFGITFEAIDENGHRNTYNMWDLATARDMFIKDKLELENGNSDYKLNHAQRMQDLQNALFALSDNPNVKTTLVIDYDANGNVIYKTVRIAKETVKKQPYEIIMSQLYKTTFGLRAGDSIGNIINDKLFFFKRAVENWENDKNRLPEEAYDVQLKQISGKHINLLYDTESNNPDGFEELQFDPYIDLQGTIWLTNNKGDKIMKLSSKDDVVLSNGSGDIIIKTKDLKWYCDNSKYVDLTISSGRDENTLQEILGILRESDSKQLKSLFNRLDTLWESRDRKEAFEDKTPEEQAEERAKFDHKFISVGRYNFESTKKALHNFLNNRYIDDEIKYELLDYALNSDKDTFNEDKLREDVESYGLRDSIADQLIKMRKGHIGSIFRNSKYIGTSFQKSLEVLAARIPAQCMQSFMSMKVAGFDTSGLNTAYVSRFLTWLQGSDYDIDKVSLLGFKFRNGHFITWSNFMDLTSTATLKASEELSYPTNLAAEVLENDAINKTSLNEDALENVRLDTSIDKENREGVRTLYVQVGAEEVPLLEVRDAFKLNKIKEFTDTYNDIKSEYDDISIEKGDAEAKTYLKSKYKEVLGLEAGRKLVKTLLKELEDHYKFVGQKELVKENKKAGIFTINPIADAETLANYETQIQRVVYGVIPTGGVVSINGADSTVINDMLVKYGFSLNQNVLTLTGENVSVAKDFYDYITREDLIAGIPVSENLDSRIIIKNESGYTLNYYPGEFADEKVQVAKIKALAKFIDAVNKFGGIPKLSITEDLDEETKEAYEEHNNALLQLMDEINEHNLYLKDGKDYSQDALLNFVSSNMYNVGTNPSNLILGTQSVDAKDGSVNRIKKLANEGDYKTKLKRYDPGSITSLWNMEALTIGGKKNTGIVAANLKVFEGLTQYTNMLLNEGTHEELQDLLAHRNIAGKDIHLLANVYQQNKHNFTTREILEALDAVDQTLDAYLEYSGFLSLSTDNAKDPTLAKINAGEKLLGLYLCGVAVGIDVPSLVKILTSKAAAESVKLLTSNMFNNAQGFFDVNALDRYLASGPILVVDEFNVSMLNLPVLKAWIISVWNREHKKADSQLSASSKIGRKHLSHAIQKDGWQKFNDALVDSLKNITKEVHKGDDALEVAELLENGNQNNDSSEVKEESATTEKAKENLWAVYNLLKKVQTLVRDFAKSLETIKDCWVLLPNGRWVQAWSQIRRLNLVANEFKRFSQVAKLNLQLPNAMDEQLAWIRKFEKGIASRISEISKLELDNHPEMLQAIDELELLNKELYALMMQLGILSGELFDRLKYSVSLSKFVNDAEYQKKICSIYGKLKYVVNVYDAMAKLPHYLGYARTLAALSETMGETSKIYQTVNYISQNVIKSLGDELHRKKELTRLIDWVNDCLTNDFLLNRGTNLTIKSGSKYYEKSYGLTTGIDPTLKTVGEGATSTIQLGTLEGNMSFKYIMENEVLPDLKEKYPAFDLIRDLNQIKFDKTNDRNTLVKMATKSTMLPRSEQEIQTLAKYKEDLITLSNIRLSQFNGEINLVDALFAYNLIVNKGKVSGNSLTNLFEDYAMSLGKLLTDGLPSAFIEDYYNSRRVPNESLLEELAFSDNLVQNFLMATALYDPTYKSKAEYIYIRNPFTRLYVLAQKINKEEIRAQYTDEDLGVEDYGIDDVAEDYINEDYSDYDDDDYEGSDSSNYKNQRAWEAGVEVLGYKILGVSSTVDAFNNFATAIYGKLEVEKVFDNIEISEDGKLIKSITYKSGDDPDARTLTYDDLFEGTSDIRSERRKALEKELGIKAKDTPESKLEKVLINFGLVTKDADGNIQLVLNTNANPTVTLGDVIKMIKTGKPC